MLGKRAFFGLPWDNVDVLIQGVPFTFHPTLLTSTRTHIMAPPRVALNIQGKLKGQRSN
jgi:hypothetical protein